MTTTIVKMGNQILQRPSAEVTVFDTQDLHALAQKLLNTRMEYDGAGLAAPQIGIAKRAICFGGETERYRSSKGTKAMVLVNPTFQPLTDEMVEGWEGCLSVPWLRGLVSRYHAIRFSGFDVYGNVVSEEISGFLARVVQHEVDHIDGILFPQRIKDLKHFGYEDELVECEAL